MLPFFLSVSGNKMLEHIDQIKQEFEADASSIKDKSALEEIRIKYLGRKGKVSNAFQLLSDVPKEQKPEFGQRLNQLKKIVEERYDELTTKFVVVVELKSSIDLTLDGRKPFIGRKHPLVQMADEIKSVFMRLGFVIEDGPEIETDYYNFEALNIPSNHPARDMQDTLYITNDIVLRTHTSPVQIRVMEKSKPPIRIIAPGRVYRRDTPDASHSPLFHQVEGLVVDENITFADLKGVIEAFAHQASFHLRNQALNMILTVSSAVAKVAAYVKIQVGLKYPVLEWFIQMYLKQWDMTQKSIRVMHLAWGLTA